ELVTHAIDPARADRNGLLASIIERERPAGIVPPPPLSDDPALRREMKRVGARVVAVSAGEKGREVVPSAGIDERAGGRAIGDYLVSLGHRRIGFVKGPPDHLGARLPQGGICD